MSTTPKIVLWPPHTWIWMWTHREINQYTFERCSSKCSWQALFTEDTEKNYVLVALKNFQTHREIGYIFTHSTQLTQEGYRLSKDGLPMLLPFSLLPTQRFPTTGKSGLELSGEHLIDWHALAMVRSLCFTDKQSWMGLFLIGQRGGSYYCPQTHHPRSWPADSRREQKASLKV